LGALKGVAPDWLLVFFELLRIQKTRSLEAGSIIELRRPIWESAGVETLDRRKKVLTHLGNRMDPDILQIVRKRGAVPVVILGGDFARFHSTSAAPYKRRTAAS